MVADNVMASLLRKELDGEAAHIADCIGAALFTTGGAQTQQNRCLFAHAIQELG